MQGHLPKGTIMSHDILFIICKADSCPDLTIPDFFYAS